MLDVSFIGAFAAGLLSFLSPCILPIVPFYLSYMAGVGMNQITANADGTVAITPAVRSRAVLSAGFFALGVITIFVAMGASASVLGGLVADYMDWLRMAAAALIIVLGLHFLGVVRIGFLYRQFRAEAGETSGMSILGAYVVGLAFAFGWTPCVGPVLAAILFTAGAQETAWEGAALLGAYAVGIGIPFVAAAAFAGPFMSLMRRFRRHMGTVERVMGGALVVTGLLFITNSVSVIGGWMQTYVPAMG
jgi:cytochrome c-type biogenesis protein